MTVQNENTKNIYVGNGSTTVFPFTFHIHDNNPDYIKVYVTGSDGVDVLTDNYTIDMQDKKITYPKTGEPLKTGDRLTIDRELPFLQLLNLVNQGPFFAEEIEKSFDKNIMLMQQIKDKLDRALAVGVGVDTSKFNATIPLVAGKSIRINDGGTGFEVTDDPKLVYEATVGMRNETEALRNEASGFSQNANNQAAAALASANKAKASETNAEYWALYGENAVKDIHLSVQAADESEANAKVSENNAKGYEASAKSSADTALANANSATSSANTASVQAQSASASATRANNSETNAKTSETNARNSELEAIRQADRAEAYGSKGEVYDSSKAYSPADVVMVSNGNLYRCIVASTGENPVGSSKWVPVSMVDFLVFEADENGDLMPRLTLVTATNEGWETDVNGDIMPVA